MAEGVEADAAMATMGEGLASEKKKSRTKVEILEDRLLVAEQKSTKLNADVTALEVMSPRLGTG